jgi:hypothetical protein
MRWKSLGRRRGTAMILGSFKLDDGRSGRAGGQSNQASEQAVQGRCVLNGQRSGSARAWGRAKKCWTKCVAEGLEYREEALRASWGES